LIERTDVAAAELGTCQDDAMGFDDRAAAEAVHTATRVVG
jgi:hypothetical protein